MAYYITLSSAADFWRRVYASQKAPDTAKAEAPKDAAFGGVGKSREYLPKWVDDGFLQLEEGKLHLLVFDKSSRHQSSSACPHLWKGPLPPESFYRLNDETFVASPEFTYLQMASVCSLGQLVAYGCEICGRFAFDPDAERGFRTRDEPLTTVRKLKRFLEMTASVRGKAKALRALEYVVEETESPMETLTAMLLHLPYRYGGYGLQKPTANKVVDLSSKARSILHQRSCRIDLQWEHAKIAVEFLGKYDHDGQSAFERDRKRTNALIEMGFEVVELTSGQVRDWEAFEVIAQRIARRTGKRIAPQQRGLTPARQQLRKTLFAWNASCGRP